MLQKMHSGAAGMAHILGGPVSANRGADLRGCTQPVRRRARGAGAAGESRRMSNPLILTRDETLLDELLRLAAAAGVMPEVVPDPGAALRGWSAASAVLVGVDQLEALTRLGPTRRGGLHVVAWGAVPDAVFRLAVEVGAENV